MHWWSKKMRDGWEFLKLSEVIDIKHGFAFKGEHFSDDPALPTVVTPGNFAIGGGFRVAKTKTYSGPIPEDYVLHAGDLVVTMTDLSKTGDTLGMPAVVPSDGTYLHNQRIGRVFAKNKGRISLEFLSYYLRNRDYQQFIVGTATGSTVRHTSPSKIMSHEALLPPLPEQREIAEILSSFDRLIECNRLLSQNMMDLTRIAVLEAISDAGESRPLDALAEFVNGKNFTAAATGTGMPVIRTPEVRTGPTQSTIYNDVLAAPNNVADCGDVLFVWSGSLMVNRWRWDSGLVNQHVFKVVPKHGYPDWLVYFLIERQMQWFLSLAADKATTMGHIKREHLRQEVPLPSQDEISRLDKTVEPIWRDSLERLKENDELVKTRDALLPMLLSGKITPNSATKLLEDVTK